MAQTTKISTITNPHQIHLNSYTCPNCGANYHNQSVILQGNETDKEREELMIKAKTCVCGTDIYTYEKEQLISSESSEELVGI